MAEKEVKKPLQAVNVEGSIVNTIPPSKAAQPDKTPVLIYMTEDHPHGHLGFLKEGNVYKVWKHWVDLLKKDGFKVFKVVTEKEAEKIIESNQKKIDKAAEQLKKEQEKAEEKDTKSPETKDAGADGKKETK